MEALELAFWDYFIYLPLHLQKWQMASKEKLPCLTALKNQLEQYRLVKSKKWSDEILMERFPDVENRLLEKIIIGIEREMEEFRKLQSSLALFNRKLFRKYDAVMRNSNNVQLEEFTSRGTVVPPIWQLFELLDSSKEYFAVLYLQLDIAFSDFDYQDVSSLTKFEEIILENSKVKNIVRDTIAETTFYREPLS